MSLELFSVAAILTLPRLDHTLWTLGACQDRYVKDRLCLRLVRPQRFMDTCYVFHFSSNPQLVSMKRRLFGSFRGKLTQAELGPVLAFAQYRS
jgi:hypothetical protein